MKFGTYFYPWFSRRKWSEAPTYETPLIGKYDSADPFVLKWQLDLIKWCGFDYVLFELVPIRDWSFRQQVEVVDTATRYLRSIGLEWSFMPDCRIVPPGQNVLDEMTNIVRYVCDHEHWLDGLTTGPTGRPLWFVYRAIPDCARVLLRSFPQFEFRFPIWLPHWGAPDEELSHERYAAFVRCALESGSTMREALIPQGYVSFWESTETIHLYDGFCSVAPGFDDTLLGRKPQWLPVLDRCQGRTLIHQLDQALAHRPEHILVYSWNEYFETSQIEPTRESGMMYLRLTRDRIREAKGFER